MSISLLILALVSVDWSTCMVERSTTTADNRRVVEHRHIERWPGEDCEDLLLPAGDCTWTDTNFDGLTGPPDLLLLNQCWGQGWTAVPLE